MRCEEKMRRAIVIRMILLISLVGACGSSTQGGANRGVPAHPAIFQLAAEDPGQIVSIIVQTTQPDDSLEDRTLQLGGKITKDLSIIQAFAAELSAQAALELARHPGVLWVSPDASVEETSADCAGCISTSSLINAYVQAIGATSLWNSETALQGQGITVAVVDSGVRRSLTDIKGQVLAQVRFNSVTKNYADNYGHGTHIAGIISGNGAQSNGKYIGVAPKANLVSVKITDETGAASASDLVAGLQWVLENKEAYNIRVVNLSMNSSMAESYHTSPIDAAVEILWFNGIVVVVSAGNNNSGVLYPPANDPFVITVGAANDQGTVDWTDDVLAGYSAAGVTSDGFYKPDFVAPGHNIVSLLSNSCGTLVSLYPDHVVDSVYFRMSGTSMASAVAAGAIALLLQDEPGLNPDQVKQRLMTTARPFFDGSGAGYLDIHAAVNGDSTHSANTGIAASHLLWTGPDPVTWGSVNWGSVNWESVNWGSVNWGSVNWGSVNWGSDYWEP